MEQRRRIIIGMSGASGAPIGIAILKALKSCPDVETCLILTDGAREIIRCETPHTLAEVTSLADKTYDIRDFTAPAASGTFPAEGMIIAPCSMKTAAGIACGYADNLLLRAADVTLKERRKLVLIAREAPLSTIHLRNLTVLSECGAVILPPVLSFYQHPETLEDQVTHIAGKALSHFGIVPDGFRRWSGLPEEG